MHQIIVLVIITKYFYIMKKRINIVRMSQGELVHKCQEMASFMRRDSEDFLTFQVNESDIDAFELITQKYAGMRDDIRYRIAVVEQIDIRNTTTVFLKKKMRSILHRIKTMYAPSSWEYRSFDGRKYYNSPPRKLLEKVNNMIVAASNQLPNLEKVNITSADLEELTTLASRLNQSLIDERSAVAVREFNTLQRADKAAELFGILKQYSLIGKSIWEDVSEAKYNNYLISK